VCVCKRAFRHVYLRVSMSARVVCCMHVCVRACDVCACVVRMCAITIVCLFASHLGRSTAVAAMIVALPPVHVRETHMCMYS